MAEPRRRLHQPVCENVLGELVEAQFDRQRDAETASYLFVEEDAEAARAARTSVVAPAEPSPATRKKARTRKATDGTGALSFQALMDHMALLSQDHLEENTASGKRKSRIELFAEPTPKQKQALQLLGVSLR